MPPYAYLRKSSVRDLAHDLGPETQEREVRALAARFGDDGPALRLLADWDVSGRREYTAKRTGYLALVAAIEDGEASAVYSYSLSRLGRSVSELSKLFDRCQDRRIPIRLVVDSIDTSTASGVLTANVLSSVAQFEAQVTSERIKAAHATKRARGQSLRTVRLFGEQRTVNGVAQGTDENLQDVLDAFDEAGSYSGAARLLNERGVAPKSSKRGWWPSAVAQVVGRSRTVPVTRRGVKAIGPDHILGQLLRCPTCGTRLTGLADRWQRYGGPRVRYACRLGSVSPHPRMSVSEHLILPAVKEEVSHLQVPHDRAMAGRADDRKRAELEQRRLRVLDNFEAGHITREEREARLEPVYDEMRRLDAQRTAMEIPQIDWSWQPRNINAVLRALFESIELDVDTFQPLPDGFKWTVPEWRAT